MKRAILAGFRSGRRHPHRSAERNKGYGKKEEAQRQQAQIGSRFRGAQDHSNGSAVGQGKTSKRGALMPPSMLRCNPTWRECGIKMRQGASRPICDAPVLRWSGDGATFHPSAGGGRSARVRGGLCAGSGSPGRPVGLARIGGVGPRSGKLEVACSVRAAVWTLLHRRGLHPGIFPERLWSPVRSVFHGSVVRGVVESGGGLYIPASLGDGRGRRVSGLSFRGFGGERELKNFLLLPGGSISLRASIKSLICRCGKLFRFSRRSSAASKASAFGTAERLVGSVDLELGLH